MSILLIAGRLWSDVFGVVVLLVRVDDAEPVLSGRRNEVAQMCTSRHRPYRLLCHGEALAGLCNGVAAITLPEERENVLDRLN